MEKFIEISAYLNDKPIRYGNSCFFTYPELGCSMAGIINGQPHGDPALVERCEAALKGEADAYEMTWSASDGQIIVPSFEAGFPYAHVWNLIQSGIIKAYGEVNF